MLKLVRNLALGAALITVAVAVWRDYGALVTLKRAFVAYMVTFFLTGGLFLIAIIGLRVHEPPPPPAMPAAKPKRRKKATRSKVDEPAPEVAAEATTAAESAPEPVATN